MKFLCGGCSRLEDIERFRLDAGVLVVTCTQCGAESRAGQPTALALVTPLRAAPSPPDLSRAFEVPEGHCAKCISRRPAGAETCAHCGLVFAQAVDTFSPSEWLKGEWLQLLQSWSDEQKHDAVRLEALNRGELPEVGRLYRLQLAAQPGDVQAQRGRDEVLRLAVMPRLTMRDSQAAPEVPKWKYIALSAVILFCLFALFYLVRQMLQLS